MASAELSRRVEKVVGYPPLCEAAIVQAEQNRPNLRIVGT